MNKIQVLADVIASIVILSLVAFIGLAVTGAFGSSLATVSATWFSLYAFVVIMSATKLYGKKIYDAVKSVGSGLLTMSGNNPNNP